MHDILTGPPPLDFGPEAGYYQADFFVRDFGWEGLLEGLEAVHSQLLAGGGDLLVPFGS